MQKWKNINEKNEMQACFYLTVVINISEIEEQTEA